MASRHTPSDFALAHCIQAELDALAARYPDLQDIVPLTPLQQGLAFESTALEDGAHDPYHVQLLLTFEGQINEQALREAWFALLARHAVLRLVLAPTEIAPGHGVVRTDTTRAWRTASPEGASAQVRVQQLREQDRALRFDLQEGPLVRACLARTDANTHVLLVASHHLLLDGWSMPVLLEEFARLYAAQCAQRPAQLARPFAWRDHLAWLASRDREQARHYWQAHLQGLCGPSRLTLPAPSAPSEAPGTMGDLSITVDTTVTLALEQFARQQGLTQASVLQGLFALLLARLSQLDEIVIGSVRNGRSSQLPGIDKALGLFIDTLPLRLTLPAGESLVQWLRAQQTEQSEQDEHAHLGLMGIQTLAGMAGQAMFEALFVFENYPIEHSPEGFGALDIQQVEVKDGTHYPVALAVLPGGDAACPNWRIRLSRCSIDRADALVGSPWAIASRMAACSAMEVAGRCGTRLIAA